MISTLWSLDESTEINFLGFQNAQNDLYIGILTA